MLVRFVSMVVRIAIILGLLGQLTSCTLTMMGLATKKSETGIMSYSKFTRLLTE